MKHENIQIVKFRRKREGKTNYKKRINLITSKKTRLVIRKTLTKIIIQFIDFKLEGDLVKLGIDSTKLKQFGWKGSYKNLPAAYLIGYLAGKKALKKGIKKVILDIGLNTSIAGVKVYAALKGAIDAGLDVKASKDIFPSQERINGKHIQNFSNNVEEMKKKIDESEK